MTRTKKGDKKGSIESEGNAAGASTKDNDANKGKNDISISSSVTIETVGSIENSQASANLSQNEAEEKLKQNVIANSASVTHATMDSNEHSNNLSSDGHLTSLSATKSKKRRKNRGKPATDTSSKETEGHEPNRTDIDLIKKRISELEGHAPNCTDIDSINKRISEFEGDDPNRTEIYLVKFADIIAAQIEIESGKSEPQQLKYSHKHKVESPVTPPYPDLKRKPVSNSRDKNAPSSCKDTLASTSANESSTKDRIRPVIFMTDKTTQTDLLPKPSIISPFTEGKTSASINSDSDSTSMTKAIESAAVLTDLPNLEKISENIEIWKKMGSNLSSDDETLQSIADDFLRDLKMATEKFEERIIKCLKPNK